MIKLTKDYVFQYIDFFFDKKCYSVYPDGKCLRTSSIRMIDYLMYEVNL